METRKVPSKRHTQGACSHIYVKGTRDIVLSRDYNLTPQLIVLFSFSQRHFAPSGTTFAFESVLSAGQE